MIDNLVLLLVHGALVVLFVRIATTADPEEAPPPRPARRTRPRLPGGEG